MDENKNNDELFGIGSDDNKDQYKTEIQSSNAVNEEPIIEPEPINNVNNNEYSETHYDFDRKNTEHGRYYNGEYNNGEQTPFVFKTVPEKPKKVKENKSYPLRTIIISVLIAAIVGAGSGIGSMFVASQFLNGKSPSNTEDNVSYPKTTNIDVKNVDSTVVEAVATKVTPSVVGIRTTVSSYNFLYGEQESSGEGSGIVYTADGYIITNYHVIQQAAENRGKSSKILVFLSYGNDSNGYEASIVGYNISCDLAVIKINASGLTPISFTNSSDLNVGQFVVAIGNPGGLQFMGSVTYGVISGLNRIISDTGIGSGVELIQTDAAINPGNSGGALVNIKGELVGVNSSKLVSESYEGMGFAIPANTTKEICDKIISKENEQDPFLGITINEKYTADILKQYGYPAGAVVYSVVPGSPAEDAGITKNDIITNLNGVEIKDYTSIGDAIRVCKPGQKITVKIFRNQRTYSVDVTLGSNNSQ